MSRALWWGLGGLAAAAGVGGAIYYATRDEDQPVAPTPPAETNGAPPSVAPTPVEPSAEEKLVGVWENVLPLPTAADVSASAKDLETNWGSTPRELRPLFMLMEEVSAIRGSGRIFSVISYGEARWKTTARNGDGDTARDKRERIGSLRAWNRLAKCQQTYRPEESEEGFPGTPDFHCLPGETPNVPLKYGNRAADFGSGGLFGALAPYFLATGLPEVGKSQMPLRDSDPRIVHLPRVAGFGAAVYLERLINNYTIDDHLDIKVGWGCPCWLVGDAREGNSRKRVRDYFAEHFAEVGIDRSDTSTIPEALNADDWPGVLTVFERLVGTLPTLVEVTP